MNTVDTCIVNWGKQNWVILVWWDGFIWVHIQSWVKMLSVSGMTKWACFDLILFCLSHYCRVISMVCWSNSPQANFHFIHEFLPVVCVKVICDPYEPQIIMIIIIIIIIVIIIIIIITFKGAIRDFWQSPHCAANRLQHVRSSGPGAIVCKSCATHRALITCNMLCCMPQGTKGQLSY